MTPAALVITVAAIAPDSHLFPDLTGDKPRLTRSTGQYLRFAQSAPAGLPGVRNPRLRQKNGKNVFVLTYFRR
jgi:hypothetical protein